MSPGLTLITPTGGRQEAFSLCERWISCQDYGGLFQWLVVDDCLEPTKTTMRQELITVEPFWKHGQITLARNLLAAIPLVQYDSILVVEDDDYYPPHYLTKMCRLLEFNDLVGDQQTIYYQVTTRTYRPMTGARHASLCQTGMNRLGLQALKEVCLESSTAIDIRLWRVGGLRRQFFVGVPRTTKVIGMKCMPGRLGAASGHCTGFTIHPDPQMAKLREWVGDEADFYAKYYIARQAA